MKNEIKEITEIITRLQDCGRKRISRTEGVIVNNEDIATALYKAGYRKRTMMDRDKLAKLIDEFLTKNEDGYYCEQFADHLIANGIGDITAEKHRADVAEEALKLAVFDYKACVENEVCKKYKTKAEKILYIREQTEIEMDKILSMLKEK